MKFGNIMSRIGKKIIQIPEKVEVKIEGDLVMVKGSKGELSRKIRPEIKVEVRDNQVFVSPASEKELVKNKQIKALWGLTRALLANMITGVNSDFEKRLEIHGIGFKAEVRGEVGELVLNIGFSHQVIIKIPQGLKVLVEKNIIIVSGADKELVGQFSAVLRKIKPHEPYKGKGIKYLGEQVRRKAGKKVATTSK